MRRRRTYWLTLIALCLSGCAPDSVQSPVRTVYIDPSIEGRDTALILGPTEQWAMLGGVAAFGVPGGEMAIAGTQMDSAHQKLRTYASQHKAILYKTLTETLRARGFRVVKAPSEAQISLSLNCQAISLASFSSRLHPLAHVGVTGVNPQGKRVLNLFISVEPTSSDVTVTKEQLVADPQRLLAELRAVYQIVANKIAHALGA